MSCQLMFLKSSAMANESRDVLESSGIPYEDYVCSSKVVFSDVRVYIEEPRLVLHQKVPGRNIVSLI